MSLRSDAERVVQASVAASMPGPGVRRALAGMTFSSGRLLLVAAGKAAWPMAEAAYALLGTRVSAGIVITKHGHARGPIGPLLIREAGHPVPDADTFSATREALELTRDLKKEDSVLFLLSGGGSALFEAPLIPPEELQSLTQALLDSGADITEINTLRKRLSAVKGGRFAEWCAPAAVRTVVLSDVVGDRPDVIASGPAWPDASDCARAKGIMEKYALSLSPEAGLLLEKETPKTLENVTLDFAGNLRLLCAAAETQLRALGYEPILLTDSLSCEAGAAGVFLADCARSHAGKGKKLALLAGGETVVHRTGTGLGGRSQHLALSAAAGLAGVAHAAVFSFGSDGTDGPTDAAGGYADGATAGAIAAAGVDLAAALANFDSYHALDAAGGLIRTGPTGTNVNDLAVALIDG